MPSKKILEAKQEIVSEIKDKASNSKSIVLFDYRGLTDDVIKSLRNNLKDSSSEYKVYKNTLLKLAFKDLNIDFHIDEIMQIKNWNDEIPFIKKMLPIIAKFKNNERIPLSTLIDILKNENSELAMIFKSVVSENRVLFLQLFLDKWWWLNDEKEYI